LGAFRISITSVDDPATSPQPRLQSIYVVRSADDEHLTLQFDRELDPQHAVRAGTYQLEWAGPDGQFGTSDDRTLDLTATDIRYDAATRQVVLRIKLPPGQYRLQIKPAAAVEGANQPGVDDGASLQAELDQQMAAWPAQMPLLQQQDAAGEAAALIALDRAQLDRWFEAYSQIAPDALDKCLAALAIAGWQSNRAGGAPRRRKGTSPVVDALGSRA
jgi:hypothetical protein